MRTPAISNFASSRALSIASGIALSGLWLCFSIVHFEKFRATGDAGFLCLLIAETMGAAFFLFRTDPATVSTRPTDWLIAVAGTYSTFLFRPSDYGVLPIASQLMIPGSIMLICGLASLNRSFAIVPAKRVLKTSMMYRIVRHPLYASYCVIFSGYLLSNTSATNAVAYLALLTLLVMRISREEAHLMKDDAYRAYAEKTRYRLIPFVY